MPVILLFFLECSVIATCPCNNSLTDTYNGLVKEEERRRGREGKEKGEERVWKGEERKRKEEERKRGESGTSPEPMNLLGMKSL